ncbi:MAG: hypothetical protein V3W20_10425 [Candidatus Neomarinimicrobiota bacterium]
MSLNTDFEVCLNDCCDTVQFCDTTCEFLALHPELCADGYGVNGNPTKRDISYTRFNWVLPDGSNFTGIDKEWKPGTRSFGSFTMTAGTTGYIIVGVTDKAIGQAIFLDSIENTLEVLIQNINASSESTGWQAYLNPDVANNVVIESINSGVEYNGLAVNISLSGDLAITLITDPTEGGTDDTDCTNFTLEDIYGLDDCPPFDTFPDGVHNITYIVYDSDDVELDRISKNVLFDCNTRNCIKELVLASKEGLCKCDQSTINERLIMLRASLEEANIEMENCNFDCANDTIQAAAKRCSNLCNDC